MLIVVEIAIVGMVYVLNIDFVLLFSVQRKSENEMHLTADKNIFSMDDFLNEYFETVKLLSFY